MKMSNMLISTLREVPAEAEIDSHKLMLRAGMIRKMAAGIYNYMPLGLKVLKNVEDIVREEMNAAGAQEFLASAMIPAELWQESGRWDAYGAEMFRVKDRGARDFCLGPTHEEVFTDIARNEIKAPGAEGEAPKDVFPEFMRNGKEEFDLPESNGTVSIYVNGYKKEVFTVNVNDSKNNKGEWWVVFCLDGKRGISSLRTINEFYEEQPNFSFCEKIYEKEK